MFNRINPQALSITCGLVILTLFGVSLAGCGSSQAVETDIPATTAVAVTTPEPAAPTITNISSPTVQRHLVALVAPDGSETTLVTSLQETLGQLANQDGLSFEVYTDFTEADISESIRAVVVIPPDPGVTSWAVNHPEVEFLAVGIQDLQPLENLSVIGSQGVRPDQQGFLAGYLAAVITPDWRVGVITPAGLPDGRAAQLGFSNGVIFFCGLCRPAYPPFVQYPVFAEIPSGASQADQQAAADTLIANGVKTVYVYPGAGDESLLQYLAQAGVNLIGGVTPSLQTQTNWVATVRSDLAGTVRQVWPTLLNSSPGVAMDAEVVIDNANENLFSPGRQRLVEILLADLLAGFVDTGVNPLTGEPK